MKAVILSCQGPELLPKEEAFFKDAQPLGFILFERHCKNREQVKKLINDLKATVSHSFVPILIDQEGGRVVRLRPPEWRSAYPASAFGKLAERDLPLAGQCAFWQARLIGQELAELGINVNCAPCADLFMPDADPIIGDRAFSEQIPIIHHLSLQTIKGLQSQGIIPIIKHLPGHGRAPVDSHKKLPIVETPLDVLEKTDFLAFQELCRETIPVVSKVLLSAKYMDGHVAPAFAKATARQVAPRHDEGGSSWRANEMSVAIQENQNFALNRSSWGMTAHVVYTAVDALQPATHSAVVIQKIIRHWIGFQGFLISDCLTMEALEGSFTTRTEKAFQAGCDAVLYCKSNLDEMKEVANASPLLSSKALERLQASLLPQVQTLSLTEQRDYQKELKRLENSR